MNLECIKLRKVIIAERKICRILSHAESRQESMYI